MDLVTLSSRKSITIGLDTTVEWTSSALREVGKATFVIPASSPAWDEDVIDPRGGFFVKIVTHRGPWHGVAIEVADVDEGFRVTAWDYRVFIEYRKVASNRSFWGVTAGCIARRAFMDAMVGIGGMPFTIGSILEAPPIIHEYRFTGQTLLNVLSDLADRTGHYWEIDGNGTFHWVSLIGRSHDFILVDDGKFSSSLKRRSLREEMSESIEVESSGRTFSVLNPSVPITWPSQETRDIQ